MHSGHLELDHPISDIQRGHSYRRTIEEDLDELCESIERTGLLAPPSLTEGYVLIAGERRLAALERLGREVTPVWIVHGVSDKLSRILAIRDEQTLRKALKPIEQAELYEELKELYAEDAARRGAVTRFGSPDRDQKLAESTTRDGGAESAPPPPVNSGKSRVQAAKAVTGRDSREMLERIAELRRIAADDDEDPIVRQHAAEALIELNEDGKVNGRYLAVKTRQQVTGLHRFAEHPDTPEAVRDAARQELHALAVDLPPAEAMREAKLALDRVTALSRAAAKEAQIGWTDVDPLMREKHANRKLVDLLRREHGWWDRFDPATFGTYADDAQWDLVTSYIAGATGFLEAASGARTAAADETATQAA